MQTKTLKHLQITNVLFENVGVLVCNTFKMRNVFPGIYSVNKICQVWYLIVSTPDLCNLTYFHIFYAVFKLREFVKY